MPLDGHSTMQPLPTLPDLIAEARESGHSDEAIAAALEEAARKGGLHCGQSSIRVYAAQC